MASTEYSMEGMEILSSQNSRFLETFFKSINSTTENIRVKEKRLNDLRNKLEMFMKGFQNYPSNIRSNLITMNIGGERVSISRHTLEKFESSYFTFVYGGLWDHILPRDSNGKVFLDYDNQWIDPILNYFRTCSSNEDYYNISPESHLFEGLKLTCNYFELKFSYHQFEHSLIKSFKNSHKEILRQFPNRVIKSTLLFKISRDGHYIKNFLKNIHNKTNTLMVGERTNSGAFGLFNPSPWNIEFNTNNVYKPFYFNFDDKEKPIIKKLKTNPFLLKRGLKKQEATSPESIFPAPALARTNHRPDQILSEKTDQISKDKEFTYQELEVYQLSFEDDPNDVCSCKGYYFTSKKRKHEDVTDRDVGGENQLPTIVDAQVPGTSAALIPPIIDPISGEIDSVAIHTHISQLTSIFQDFFSRLAKAHEKLVEESSLFRNQLRFVGRHLLLHYMLDSVPTSTQTDGLNGVFDEIDALIDMFIEYSRSRTGFTEAALFDTITSANKRTGPDRDGAVDCNSDYEEKKSSKSVSARQLPPHLQAININASGTIVTVSANTLLQAPAGSYLRNLLSTEWGHDVDEEGNLYQEVNPELFRKVVSYLRLKAMMAAKHIPRYSSLEIVVEPWNRVKLEELLDFYLLTADVAIKEYS